MAGLSYPAARVVAKRLEARIAVSKTAYKNGTDAPKPDAASVEEIITTAFWASLRREEGHSPRISIAFVPPEQSLRPLQFSPRVRLDATLLSRIAPAVEKPGIHIGVWSYEADLYARPRTWRVIADRAKEHESVAEFDCSADHLFSHSTVSRHRHIPRKQATQYRSFAHHAAIRRGCPRRTNCSRRCDRDLRPL